MTSDPIDKLHGGVKQIARVDYFTYQYQLLTYVLIYFKSLIILLLLSASVNVLESTTIDCNEIKIFKSQRANFNQI